MRNRFNILKTTLVFLVVCMFFVPSLAYAQGQNFIPCGFDGPDEDNIVSGREQCEFEDLLYLVQNVLDWIVMISFPISVIAISWAGFILLTTGVADKRTEAKSMLMKVVIGFAVILAAWLIVRTIVNVILAPGLGDQFIELKKSN